MKSVVKMMVGAALLTACGTLFAQEPPTALNSAADWNKNANVTDVDGVINVKKNNIILFSKKFDIDPAKKYTLKFSCRAVNMEKDGDRSQIYAGFNVFDKNGRTLNCFNCLPVPNTMTEVVEDAPKGAKTIKVKDASKFKKPYGTINAGAKADLSDLPNFNMLGNVTDFVQKDGVWEVSLQYPLRVPVKAGTAVREHLRGGYLYTAGIKSAGKDWITMSGTITGMKNGTWTGRVWPGGAVKAQVVILVNWNNKKLETQFKDVSLTVE
jgi:hypothetical protein